MMEVFISELDEDGRVPLYKIPGCRIVKHSNKDWASIITS